MNEQLVSIYGDKAAADLAEVLARFRVAGRKVSHETLAIYTGIPQWYLLRWVGISERLPVTAAPVLEEVLDGAT